MIDPHYRQLIMNELQAIEQQENIRILYACESGSRAWGFPSRDSDYDVRFVYIRPVDWYLSIFDKRDVIERPISSMLDISGWDLKKALLLFRKSNPPLLEWLQSPIVYADGYTVADRIRSLSPLSFSPRSCLYHYLHMAQRNYRDYLQGETVRLKKYLYVLRPILACEWIERYGAMPPMEFIRLVEELIPADSELKRAVQTLLERKASGEELDEEPRIPVINDYLEELINHLVQTAGKAEHSPERQDEQLDALFRAALQEVWGRKSPLCLQKQ